MEIFLSLTFVFMIGSLIGWIIELFFRHGVSGVWVNPGFLKGPYLPIYGFGLAFLYGIASIPFESFISASWLVLLVKAIVVCIVMTIIELIAGLIFIEGMHIELWDYSNRWGNYKGIICPLFSFFWTILGAAYVIFLHPAITDAVIWLTNNLYYSFFIGMFYGIMLVDFITSMGVAVKIKKYAEEHEIVVKYEALKVHLKNKAIEWKSKHHFIRPFEEFNKVKDDDVSESFLSKFKGKFKKK